MRFCTTINCMDGRVQLPVINFVLDRFKADYVDMITEAGPNIILSQQQNQLEIQSILKKLNISIHYHNSVGVAIVGHHDCLGNPAQKELQIEHLHQSIQFIKSHNPNIETIGLWVDEDWKTQEISI